jgi:hypothetical protein
VRLNYRLILLVTLVSAIGSVLAFEQFYIMTTGAPENQTITSVYWIYTNSFTYFKLGYGATLSIILMIIAVVGTAVQIALKAPGCRMSPLRKQRARRNSYLIAAICIALMAIMLFPLAMSLLTSIKPAGEAAIWPPNYLPSRLSFSNYVEMN